MKSMVTEQHSLEIQVSKFLADLAHANHSPQTRRVYASDLAQLCAFHQGPIQTITAEVLRDAYPSSSSYQSSQTSSNSAFSDLGRATELHLHPDLIHGAGLPPVSRFVP